MNRGHSTRNRGRGRQTGCQWTPNQKTHCEETGSGRQSACRNTPNLENDCEARGRGRGKWSRQSRGVRSNTRSSSQPIPDGPQRGRGRRNERPRRNSPRPYKKIPETPQLTFEKLRNIFQYGPNDIILCLLDPRQGFKEKLADTSMPGDFLSLLLKVLVKSLSSNLQPLNQNRLLGMLLAEKFFTSNLQTLFSTRYKNNPEVFDDTSLLFSTIIERMPGRVDDLEPSIRMCLAAAKCYANATTPIPMATVARLNYIRAKVDGIIEIPRLTNRMTKMSIYDSAQPPDDFRYLSIPPSITEIRTKETPFLRKNIIRGKYSNVDHYLDVHFRLFRDDFVSPLRTGIGEYLNRDRNARFWKSPSIRIYENVRIKEPIYLKDGIAHVISFDVSKLKKVDWENSKRLINGNLLCLSDNDFQTVLLASVIKRDTFKSLRQHRRFNDKGPLLVLERGLIAVKFEDDILNCDLQRNLRESELQSVYVMAESPAFFESYRHVLKGIQLFTEEDLPLKEYLVDVRTDVKPPDYLDQDSEYDFSTVLLKSEQKTNKRCPQDTRIRENPPCLRKVLDLTEWPTPQELGMDESQRKAMHLALSSEFAVIQGPPGTGKTFVGLKITQVLLRNRKLWRDNCPILVVCFTNHALDQFLEGMLEFTDKLARIGGRSKSEALERYNLRILRRNRDFRGKINTKDMYDMEKKELKEVRQTIENHNRLIQRLKSSVLHEDGLMSLPGKDGRIVHSFVDGYVRVFRVNPIGQPWCPPSFLAAWLGVTLNEACVSDCELNEFLFDGTTDGWNFQSMCPEDELNSSIFPEEDEELIEVETEVTRITRNRQLDVESAELLLPLQISEDEEGIWAVDVTNLNNPDYLAPGLRDYPRRDHLVLVEKGLLRQRIAIRELSKVDRMSDGEVVQIRNVWQLPLVQRWRLYRRWVHRFQQPAEASVRDLQVEYIKVARQMNEVSNAQDLSILQTRDVVGLTTTGAAKWLNILRELGPRIVIVEEAAEVMESHIISALSPSTEHLIQIGDHQQLRPNPQDYHLAKKFHLDISLFERMINNNVQYETLQLQHRMRPEISRLLVPHIYKNLEDHECVKKRPEVKGVESSVFFVNHSKPEESVADSTSRSNQFEANFLVGFCRYLLQQGYQPSQITILTTYAGQLFVLQKLLPNNRFNGVTVTVVDNYQGEENDIILLSFVRSNEEGKIGFLQIDNRVNVALSRAKIGLFCIGNFRLFATRSKLWRGIVADLERDEKIGPAITAVCQKHGNLTKIYSMGQFRSSTPEGGCLVKCEEKLPCEHICRRFCHPDPHRCPEPCPKILCKLQHRCPRKCFEKCEPCEVIVKKVIPNCRHIADLECHIDEKTYDCMVLVKRHLPICYHQCEMSCHEMPAQRMCKVPCNFTLPCGHSCPMTCHPIEDVEHEMITCTSICQKIICELGHLCEKRCYEDCGKCMVSVDKELPCGHTIKRPCSKPIEKPTDFSFLKRMNRDQEVVKCLKPCTRTLPCGHQCPQICSNPCGGCKKQVTKRLYCGHENKIDCQGKISSAKCNYPCDKVLICGHDCTSTCGSVCNTICEVGVSKSAACGHVVRIPCNLSLSSVEKLSYYCNQPCKDSLPCDHICTGTCSKCLQGRIHVQCKKECKRMQICGHRCKFPCAKICPPCQQPCLMKCQHSKCQKQCGQACQECRQPCTWKCRHFQCTKLCFEICNRPRCDEPCTKLLPCQHQCIGLCGEKCPNLCRTCNEDKSIFSGRPVNTHFIELSDCGHCIEAKTLDEWMDKNPEEVGVKGCPICETPICKSHRYGNMIKGRLRDVQSIKQYLIQQNKLVRHKLLSLEEKLGSDESVSFHFPEYYRQLISLMHSPEFAFQNELIIIENQVNLLKQMAVLKTWQTNITSDISHDILNDQMSFLSRRLMESQMMDDWELQSINNEVKRVELWILYWKTKETFPLNSPENHRHGRFRRRRNRAVEVVKGLTMELASWVKCPNDHFYPKLNGICTKC